MTRNKRIYLSPKAYRVMAEYGSSGVWLVRALPPFRHVMIELDALRIPRDLAEDFVRWIEYYESRRISEEQFDTYTFNQTGRSLAERLRAAVGSAYTVEFIGETDEGGLLEPEQIV